MQKRFDLAVIPASLGLARAKLSDLALAGVIAATSMLPAFAQTSTPEETAITSASTKVLALIAFAGALYVGVALAKVGFTVAAKWVSRMGQKG